MTVKASEGAGVLMETEARALIVAWMQREPQRRLAQCRGCIK